MSKPASVFYLPTPNEKPHQTKLREYLNNRRNIEQQLKNLIDPQEPVPWVGMDFSSAESIHGTVTGRFSGKRLNSNENTRQKNGSEI